MRNEGFLVVRLGSLGDLVHTVPAVAALRASFPEARIGWAVEEKWAPLVEMVSGVDEIFPLRRTVAGYFGCMRRLRRARYGCVIDIQGLYKSAFLARASGAGRRIGFDGSIAREPGAAWLYNERVLSSGRHVAEMNLSLVVRAGATHPQEMQFPLRVPENSAERVRERLAREGIDGYMVVSPGGGWRSKCWPPERYGALCAEGWRRHRLRAVVNATTRESDLARAVVEAAAPSKPLVLLPPLGELAALLAGARVVVAADTGPLHLAAALGVPVVGLFGPTDPARNGPLPRGTVVRSVDAKVTKYRRGDYKRGGTYSPLMLSLSVDQVLAAVEREVGVAA